MTQDARMTMTQRTAGDGAAGTRRTTASSGGTPLVRVLEGVLFLGLVAVASLPSARGVSETFGWVPLWLLLVPGVAWCALRLRPEAWPDRVAPGQPAFAGAERARRAPQRGYVRGPAPVVAAMATTRRPRAPRSGRASRSVVAPR